MIMKQFVKGLIALIALSFAGLGPSRLQAQEWSAAQKEVWKNVETYWDLDAKRGVEKFMAYFHDDYLGWFNRDPMPHTKAETRKWVEHDFKTTTVLYQSIKPVAIKLHGNVAFVHYYYGRNIKDAEGKEKVLRGRWTDILTKQEDKWVMIGDHGGLEASAKE
jgi:ketosteroid isomerase-like protein